MRHVYPLTPMCPCGQGHMSTDTCLLYESAECYTCTCECDETGSVYQKSKEMVSTQSLPMGTTILRNSTLTLGFRGARYKPNYDWGYVISACYCDLTVLTSLIGGRSEGR